MEQRKGAAFMSGNYIYSSSSYGLGTISSAVPQWQKAGGNSAADASASSYQDILKLLQQANAGAAEEGKVSAKDMSMSQYKAYITEKISNISFDETRPNDEEFIQITDAGWEAMKNDAGYESWVLDKIRQTRSTSDGYYRLGGSGSYTMESFGATREDYRVQSWSKNLGEEYDRMQLQQTAGDAFWMSIGATKKQKQKLANRFQEQQLEILQGNMRNALLEELNAKASYSALLQQKMDSLKEDLKAMEARREELEEIEKTHEELTGKATGEDAAAQQPVVETIKRIMPDGTIRVTKMENGQVTEQYEKKPNMMAIPDATVPKSIDGVEVPSSQRVKWVPHYNVFDMM